MMIKKHLLQGQFKYLYSKLGTFLKSNYKIAANVNSLNKMSHQLEVK